MALSSSSSFLPLDTMINMITIKLDGTNYLIWRTQVESLLKAYDLLSYVDGSKSCPPASSIDAALSWRRTDQQIMTLVYTSLTSASMSLVVGSRTSAQVWSTLAAVYQNRSRLSKFRILDSLMSLRQDDLSVEEYYVCYKTLVDDLNARGQSLSNDDKILFFLRGLNASFDEFVTTQMGIDTGPDLVDVFDKAQWHEYSLKSMFASGHGRDSGWSGGGSVVQCQWCGVPGHVASSCSKLLSSIHREF